VREIMCTKLADAGYTVARTAATLAEAETFLADPPDLALVDLALPDGEAFGLIEKLAQQTDTKILVMSSLDEPKSVLRGFAAGAHGYIVKSAPGIEIEDAIACVMRGETPISPTVAMFLLSEWRETGKSARADKASILSPREKQILELTAEGNSRKQVARQLGISPYTVAEHSRNILRKYGVPSSAAAVAKGLALGEIG
jgi:DNA-binding NarL/FixJ family response regulator